MAGSAQIIKRLRKMRVNVDREGNKALDEVARDLLQRASALTPFLDGVLEISGRIVRGKTAKSTYRAIAFETSPFHPEGKKYALIRHEDTYRLGPRSIAKGGTEDGPVGRKYLERPYQRNRKRYLKEVEAAMVKAARSASKKGR